MDWFLQAKYVIARNASSSIEADATGRVRERRGERVEGGVGRGERFGVAELVGRLAVSLCLIPDGGATMFFQNLLQVHAEKFRHSPEGCAPSPLRLGRALVRQTRNSLRLRSRPSVCLTVSHSHSLSHTLSLSACLSLARSHHGATVAV